MDKRITTLFLLIYSFIVYSQPTLDTISNCLQQKPQPFSKFDTRNSFISNSRAKIFGFKAGVSYGKRISFGLGYNQLYPPANNFNKQIFINDNPSEFVIAKLNMFYVSGYVEYVFHRTKNWHLSMPLQLGVGKTNYKYEYLSQKIKTEDNFNFIYEPAISIEYRPIKWCGVGMDIGYRFMITANRTLNEKFNAPTYAFKFIVYYAEIYKSLFPHTKLAEKI